MRYPVTVMITDSTSVSSAPFMVSIKDQQIAHIKEHLIRFQKLTDRKTVEEYFHDFYDEDADSIILTPRETLALRRMLQEIAKSRGEDVIGLCMLHGIWRELGGNHNDHAGLVNLVKKIEGSAV